MSNILKLAKEEFDGAVENYRALTSEIESLSARVLAFEPNAVAELNAYASKLYKAYTDMKEKECSYYVAEAEAVYELNEESVSVKACAEVREVYKIAEKAVDDAVERLLEASKEQDCAHMEFTPIVEAPVSDPEQYELARTKLSEAEEKYATAEKQFDIEVALWHEARKQYAKCWKEVK